MRYYTLKHFLLIELEGHSTSSHYVTRSKEKMTTPPSVEETSEACCGGMVNRLGREKNAQEETISRHMINSNSSNLATN